MQNLSRSGTAQQERQASAPDGQSLRPDEWTLAQRLALSLDLAERLAFVNEAGQTRGSWAPILRRDPSLLLAELAAAAALSTRHAAPDTGAGNGHRQQWRHCLALATRLDDFLTGLEGEPALQSLLSSRIASHLAPLLKALHPLFPDGERAQRLRHPAWEVAPEAALERPGVELLPRRLRELRTGLSRLHDEASALARQRLPHSLGGGMHEPAMGLLLALLRLIDQARAPLNEFGERLIQHYYHDRLQFQRLPARCDRVHLLLRRDPRYARPVRILPGSRFQAGQTADGRSRSMLAEQGLDVGHMQVARLASLCLEHDPMISPEHQLAYPSRARASLIEPPTPEQAALPRCASWPVLGGGSAPDAEIGLALASPLLALAGGERRIDLDMALCMPGVPAPGLSTLMEQALRCRDRSRLPGLLGQIFACWLCASEQEEPDPALLAALRRRTRRLLPSGHRLDVDDPLSLLAGDQPPERDLVFDRVFRGLWQARLSASQGWLALDEVHVQRGAGGGLTLSLRLRPEHPAIQACSPALHGPAWPEQPVLQLCLSRRSRIFGLGLLQQLRLQALQLRVEVRGLRELRLYNQLGRLDASKPFAPFGPLPDASSYLMFSSPELMSKPLQSLSLQMHWAGLPADGLAHHYRAYPEGPWLPQRFQVRRAVLSDGRWREAPQRPLFPIRDRTRDAEAGVGDCELDLGDAQLLRLHRPQVLSAAQLAAQADYGPGSRQGFFRLQLTAPAFGHALYPPLLTEVLSHNARRGWRLRPRELPQAPYTPMLDSISLHYSAAARIPVPGVLDRGAAAAELRSADGGRADAAAVQAQQTQLIEIGPFGRSALRPSPGEASPALAPLWPGDGQLYIGLQGREADSLLSLLFQLDPSQAEEALDDQRPQLAWAAWTHKGWQTLEPYRVLLDQTEGLLRTGIIMLDLPAGLRRGCPALEGRMPPGAQDTGALFWLCLSGRGRLPRLAPLQGVWAQAISARRSPDSAEALPLPALSVQTAAPAIPGLVQVLQTQPGFDARDAEDERALRLRACELLRHRDRALNAWDFERLVLQAFPEVFKLICLPAEDKGESLCTVVVVPALAPGQEVDGTEAPRLDAATLERIRDFLRQRCSPSLLLRVRNPAYERIQVRCRLRLSPGLQTGERLRELNQCLRDYLSPWRAGGITARFDWRVRVDDVEALLRAQDGVEAVQGLSLLHITHSDAGRYLLADSFHTRQHELRPARACSLALPMRGHLLELQEPTQDGRARPTGLGLLRLGGSFIVGRDGTPAPGARP